MAVAYENALDPIPVTWDIGGETESHSFDAGSGSNRVLLVGVFWRDSNEVPISDSAVTYNGVTMTPVAAKYRSAQQLAGRIYSLANPASGSNLIAVTFPAEDGSSLGFITAWVGNGCDTTGTPVDGYSDEEGTTSSAGLVTNVTVSGDNGDRIVVFHYTRNVTDTITATESGFSERHEADNGGGQSLQIGDANGSTALNTQSTWTNGAYTVDWIAVGVNVNQAATGRASKNTNAIELGMGLGMNLWGNRTS